MNASTAINRQLFFFKQKWFTILSFMLMDNRRAGITRSSLLRWFGAKTGRDCFVRGGLQMQESFNLTLGDHVFINHGCTLDCSAPIEIGDRAQIAFKVTIITGGHEIGPVESRAGAHNPQPVKIGAGAWIGASAIIMPGVTVGEGAVVGAGSLVTKDVAPHTLVVGIPAKFLKELPQ
jgi:maltose O-acetyltransferase